MKIVSIVGARPQFIKAATVSRALAARPGMREILIHTGQHYDWNMSDIFFRELAIPAPDLNLGAGPGSHGAQTARMLTGIENALLEHRPDAVLVYGDTNSTLAAALAAAKLRVPIAHVEAGLRSFNRAMPEEINRVLADHCADWLLAPTRAAVLNLRNEGITDAKIHLVGDVMYDAALYYAQEAEQKSRILKRLGIAAGSYILCTIHRAENTDDTERLRAICKALGQLADEVPVVWPMHPRTQAVANRHDGGLRAHRSLLVIDPVGYLDMVLLEKNARMIVTDSGGVQKEAYFHHVPCATLRTETEWVELVDAGWNTLIDPTSSESIAAELLGLARTQAKPADHPPFYGDGGAAQRICDVLCAGAVQPEPGLRATRRQGTLDRSHGA